ADDPHRPGRSAGRRTDPGPGGHAAGTRRRRRASQARHRRGQPEGPPGQLQRLPAQGHRLPAARRPDAEALRRCGQAAEEGLRGLPVEGRQEDEDQRPWRVQDPDLHAVRGSLEVARQGPRVRRLRRHQGQDLDPLLRRVL
ncbi:MAG: hypothetical protein AVDCRST_MAG32-600, partial [uncultured Nocardioides sp.]